MTFNESISSLETLLTYFEKREVSFHRTETNKNTLSVSTRLDDQEGILHIHWDSTERVIRFVHILPLTVPKPLREKMIILLNRINLVLPISGFVLNEENGIIAYCSQAPLDKSGAVPHHMVDTVIARSVHTVKEILPQLKRSVEHALENDLSSLFRDHP